MQSALNFWPPLYGWFTNGGRVRDGRFDSYKLELTNRRDLIFTLVLNCDEHRLTIVLNESSTERDEMDVDCDRAPFPWCLFVQLNRVGARVMLI